MPALHRTNDSRKRIPTMLGSMLQSRDLEIAFVTCLALAACAPVPSSTVANPVPAQTQVSTQPPGAGAAENSKHSDAVTSAVPDANQAASTPTAPPQVSSTAPEPTESTTSVSTQVPGPASVATMLDRDSLDRYVVQNNDQLLRIAACFGVNVDELASLNSVVDKDKIFAGDTLFLPKGHIAPRSPRCGKGFRNASNSKGSPQLEQATVSEQPVTRVQEVAKVPPRPAQPAAQPEHTARAEQHAQTAATAPKPPSVNTVPKTTPVPTHDLPKVEVKPPCLTAWNQANKSPKGRKVLFVGGDMANLFEKYMRDAEQSNRKIDYESLIVLFAENAMQAGQPLRMMEKRIKMTFPEWYQNMTPKKKWRLELSGLKAPAVGNAEEAAKNHGADLVCE